MDGSSAHAGPREGIVPIDVAADVGQGVNGPDQSFSSPLADVSLGAKTLRRARPLTEAVLREAPVVVPWRQPDLLRPEGSR
ncbi:MAG: hypothetical protein ACRDPA_33715 [Solirubrobacteraceae bacterium]